MLAISQLMNLFLNTTRMSYTGSLSECTESANKFDQIVEGEPDSNGKVKKYKRVRKSNDQEGAGPVSTEGGPQGQDYISKPLP